MAIAALVAAFIYLWNNCEEFREFWINLWDTISSAFSTVWDAIVNFFTVTIPDAWNSVVDFFWQGYYTCLLYTSGMGRLTYLKYSENWRFQFHRRGVLV